MLAKIDYIGLHYLASKPPSSSTDLLWIGLHLLNNDLRWEGSRRKLGSYDYIEEGYSRDNFTRKDPDTCFVVDVATGRWNAKSCDKEKPFICEGRELLLLSSYLHVPNI